MMSPDVLTFRKNRLSFSPLVTPLVFFLLSMVVIYFLWNYAHEARIHNIQVETEITAEQVKLRVEAWVDHRAAILQQFGSSWDTQAEVDESTFVKKALDIQRLYSGFQAINLIDEDWIIRTVVPEATNLAALDKDLHLHPDPTVGVALQEALATNSIRRSPLIHLLQGKPGFATYFPIRQANGSFLGILNGVFVVQDLVDSCLGEEQLKQQFAFEIKTPSGESAYSHLAEEIGNGSSNYLVQLPIRFVDKDWELSFFHLRSGHQSLSLTGEGLFMIGGLLLALAISLLMRAYLLRVAELRESQSNYKMLVDNQVDMVIKVDSKYRLTFVSPSTLEKVGLPESEITGRPIVDFIHPDDLGSLNKFRTQMESNQETNNLDLRMKHGQEWMWTSWTGSNIRDAKGKLQGRVGVGRDITQQRELENRLRQGQKLQAVGQLAGGVAHDFNNIIQAIIGYIGFVKDKLDPEDESFMDLSQAELASERAATLTRQLLAFSRRQILQPTILDLNSVTQDLLPMLRRLLGESIDLDFIPDSHRCSVKADRSQLEQILVNLCVNSRDAIQEETGTISISTSAVELDEEFCQKNLWAEPGSWICLSLKDTGCGMTESTMTQIFEPFFTTKETGKGTGLGLATVYGIIKQHEGLVEVSSEPGQGTRFALYLNSTDDQVEEDEIKNLTTPKSGDETILLAEDEEMVRQLTERILISAGYRVLVAHNGIQAYDLWIDRMHDIDLVMVDVVMPLMGGRELSVKIKQDKPETRLLFISGYDSESFRLPLDQSFHGELLLKPFNRDALLKRVREVLDR